MTSIVTVTPNPAIDQTIFIPDFAAGRVNRVKKERKDIGGKGFNVASFKGLRHRRSSCYRFSGQAQQRVVRVLLAARGIKDEFVLLDGETRTNIKIVDDKKGDNGHKFSRLQCDEKVRANLQRY